MTTTEPARFGAREPGAFDHAFAVLETVARHGPGITSRELIAILPMSRATVFRIVKHLVAEGYLVRTTDLRGFALGARVLALTEASVLHRDEAIARPSPDPGD